jgi:phosphomannomutase
LQYHTTGVLIGYDGRHNSRRFASRAAAVLQSKNIKVYLFSLPVSTPYVPFGIRVLKCAAGLMVTASHNPKLDNGIKVYIANGAQIISPHDEMIQKQIELNLCPWPNVWQQPTATTCPLQQVQRAYEKMIQSTVSDSSLLKQPILGSVRFAYTSLHGVGHPYVTAAFKAIGLQVSTRFFVSFLF